MEGILRNISYEHRDIEGCHSRTPSLVSICIPNYNNAEYLYACIGSALDQSYPSIEIIIVDDCSTDNSHNVIMDTIKGRSNIIYHRLPKRCGTAWAQNVAYYLSSGEFVANLDSDDCCRPKRISCQVAFLQRHQLDIVGSRVHMLTGEAGYRNASWIKHDPVELVRDLNAGRCPVCFGTLLFRSNVLEELGGLTKKFIGTEDYDFIMRAHRAGFQIGNDPNILYLYRNHKNQRSKLFHQN